MKPWTDLSTEQHEFVIRELTERADLRELEAYDFEKGGEGTRSIQSRMRAEALRAGIAVLLGAGR